MPEKEGDTRTMRCPDCRKKVIMTFSTGKWRWPTHQDKEGFPCNPNLKGGHR